MSERRFYSQYGEDALLWTVFGDRVGYYVDVGAFDGIHLSNTYSFEEAGWTGLCIEAHPRFAPLCRANRPRSSFVQAACVGPDAPAQVRFWTEPLGLLSGIRADETEGMDRRYRRRGMAFEGFAETVVPTVTLTEALDAAGAPRQIEFVSIDVEGTELDVLRGLDWDRYEPEVLVVEGNTPDANAAIRDHLSPFGFLPWRTLGQNTFYARDPSIGERLTTAVIDVRVEDALHPDGEQATHPDHRGRRIIDDPSRPSPGS